MAVTNTNKKTIDLPFFEVLNPAPVASLATATIATAEDSADRFIYYLSGSTFYRYDTQADTFQQLANIPTAPTTGVTMRYTKFRGYHGRVIAATSSTVTIPGLRGNVLDGSTLKILYGTGAGQSRTITLASETIHDSGVVTAVSTVALTDSTKKWKPNQWAGYLVGITFGTNPTQYKKILYNDATSLTIADTNLMPHDPWNASAAYAAAAPYALASATAGAQSHYIITSQQYTLNSNWDTAPDTTSYFTTDTGGLYVFSSAAATPFFTLQYYDVVHDSWVTKTAPQNLLSAAAATDFSIERAGTNSGVLVSTTGAISGGARTLTDAGLSMTPDRFANYRIVITGGTGRGQHRRIVANTATVFTVQKPWDTNPDNTSTYAVYTDYDRMYLGGLGLSALFAYAPEIDWWMQGQHFDDGVVNNIGAIYGSYPAFGVSTGARIAAGVQAVNSTPTAGGSGYVVGDILTCSVGGTGAQVLVTGISTTGAVTSIELLHSGTATGFTTGTGRATTGGTGSGCTIEITTVGPTALITLATGHWFRAGESIRFTGCTESAWNASHTILCVPGTTTLCVIPTATANMAASLTQSTTTITDTTKNWTVNEHAGRLVHLSVAGTAPTSQVRWIVSNTANTLTVATIVAGVNGTSKYAIYDAKLFGCDVQRRPAAEASWGYASSGSTTTLVDSSKNWVVNQWAGYAFKVEAGTGFGSGRITITSNTATTLTYTTQSFTPDSTTKYEIADTWGLATAGSTTTLTETSLKNWTTNQWAGKRVRVSAGTAGTNEYTVTSNTNNALTFAVATAPDTTSAYAILGIPVRSTGIDLLWAWGNSGAATKGRYMYCPRGGTTTQIDIYDIVTGRWTYGHFFSPQGVFFGTGSSYAYDGVDTLYATVGANTSVSRVYALNIATGKITTFGQTVQLSGNVHIGNFMEIVKSPDGISYLYILHNTSTLLSRAMMF